MKISELAREAAEACECHRHTPHSSPMHAKEWFCEHAQVLIQYAMNAYAQEACKPLVAALEDVLNHRHEDKDGNHVMWVGETCFMICDNALKSHRLAHGPEEKA